MRGMFRKLPWSSPRRVSSRSCKAKTTRSSFSLETISQFTDRSWRHERFGAHEETSQARSASNCLRTSFALFEDEHFTCGRRGVRQNPRPVEYAHAAQTARFLKSLKSA